VKIRESTDRDIEGIVNVGRESFAWAFATDGGSVALEETRLVIECRKLYFQDVNLDHFLVPEIAESYPNNDYHRMYVGEVLELLWRAG